MDETVSRYLCDGGQGPDTHTATSQLSDTPQAVELTDTHHFFGIKDPVAKAAEQVGSACMNSSAGGRELPDGIPYGSRADVIKAWQHDSTLLSSLCPELKWVNGAFRKAYAGSMVNRVRNSCRRRHLWWLP